MYSVHGRVIDDNMYDFQHKKPTEIIIYDIRNDEINSVTYFQIW